MDITKAHLGYADGWRVIYQARTVFAVLLLIAVLVNLAVFFVAKFSGLTKSADMPIIIQSCMTGACPIKPSLAPKGPGQIQQGQPTDTAPATTTAPTATGSVTPGTRAQKPVPEIVVEAPADLDRAVKWYSIFSNIMNLTAIIALVSILFMVFCALAGMMMVIAGHLPGAGLLTSAFFWSIGIVALLLPWTSFLPQTTCLPIGIPGFGDIQASLRLACSGEGCGLRENLAEIVQLWVRFVVFPVIIILIDILYLSRTRQAATDIRSITLEPSAARSQL